MMEWVVFKSGIPMFDLLHAYGLGLLLSHASHQPITFSDQGCRYHLQATQAPISTLSVTILDEILSLPTPQEVREWQQETRPPSLSLLNLDGGLSALLTIPNHGRCLSLADLLLKQQSDPQAIEEGICKVMTQRTRWNTWVTTHAHAWERDLLQTYHPAHTQVSLPQPATRSGNITTLMTLDPSLGSAHRSPYSDGLVKKVNLTMQPQSFAPILAFIGAVRFLRAQRIAGQMINYTLPEALSLTISPETALPRQQPGELEASHALVRQALTYFVTNPQASAQWHGIFFQTLQTQGAQQAISRSRGYLPFQWFTQITQRLGSHVPFFWNARLQAPLPQARDECNLLTDFLLTHHPQAWLAHLRSRAMTLCTQITSAESVHTYRLYSLHEVKEITMAIETRSSTPLHTILERKEGTLHFGQALRLLSRACPSDAREVIEELDTLQTGEQLLFLLGRLVQQCSLAQAKSPFILIPSEPDFKQLLQDVDQYGARTIAGMLIVLSALRYPRTTPDIAEPEPVNAQHQDNPAVPTPTTNLRHRRSSRMVEPLTLSSEHDTEKESRTNDLY